LPADIRVRKPRDGSSTSRRVGSHHSGRRTQNSLSENLRDQIIQDGDIVDGTVTTSETDPSTEAPAGADVLISI
jgi:hypothetical protein